MVRTLQKKFVYTAMLAITILLVVLIFGINILNLAAQRSISRRRLESLMGPGMQKQESENGGRGGFADLLDSNQARNSVGFVVCFDEEGQEVWTDTSRVFSVSEETALEMASAVLESGRTSGVTDGYRYLVRNVEEARADSPAGEEAEGSGGNVPGEFQADSERPGGDSSPMQDDFRQLPESGTVIAFLDVSQQSSSIISFLIISVLIAVLCELLMIIPVRILAVTMIRPIAENMQRQKQFVTDAGHEIKTPLAIIQANTDALELFNGETKWTRNIRSQTVRLSGLMQNLLTLSKMDEAGLELAMEEFDLSAAAADTWKNFIQPAENKKIEAGFEAEPGLTVKGNRDSIVQLMSILFDNAVKYTPQGGRIFITLKKEGDRSVLREENSCLPESIPEDADRLFDRFYRQDQARTQKTGGYGIGLSAARAIAGANHAHISAESGKDCMIFTFKI